MGTGMSTSNPTPQGISALLKRAGHNRAEWDHNMVKKSGYQVMKDWRGTAKVRVIVRYASLLRSEAPAARDALGRYAATITEAGWAVQDDGRELIVTAKED
jgi:hypothetical protein